MTMISSTGLLLTRLDQRFSQIIAAMQSIFGPDINVDPNTMDGQTLAIFAESINNLDQLAEAVYQSLDPDTATGAAFSRLVKLNGISRLPGSFSTVTLVCTGNVGTVIPAGSLVFSEDGSTEWETLTDATIDSTATVTVQAQSAVMGPVMAGIGTLTKIGTPVYGWQSVTNPAIAAWGTSPETDEQLRIRRAASTTTTAVGPVDAIRGALLNQVGVRQAMVYENNTDSNDSNGQLPHSIYAIVQGGTDQDIWNVIWFKKPAGVNVIGSVTGTVVDTAGFPHTMKFDRPAPAPIYVIVNIKKRTGYPTNGADLIKAAIVAFGNKQFSIGQNVIQSELYQPILDAVSDTGSILSVLIGTAPTPTLTDDAEIAYNGIATFDVSNISVVETT